VLDRLLYSSRSTKSVVLRGGGEIYLIAYPVVIESPIFSDQGAQVALLKVTSTISVLDAAAALQQATDVNAAMASAPIDPTTQLPPSLSVAAETASHLDFRSVFEHLDGFVKIANLAAEVCWRHSAVLQSLDYPICPFHAGPPTGQTGMGRCISSI
jgi:hypothetical protein